MLVYLLATSARSAYLEIHLCHGSDVNGCHWFLYCENRGCDSVPLWGGG